jgi:hypothetical protein
LGEGEKIFPLSGWMDWIWEGETDPVRLNSRPARRLGGANREGTGPTGWLGRAGRSKATPRQKKARREEKSLRQPRAVHAVRWGRIPSAWSGETDVWAITTAG